eukprot:2354123-Rhodomonas_salina.3
MSAFNVSISPMQRKEWWVSTLGRCTVCGGALEFPLTSSVSGHVMLLKHTHTSSLLFKYDLVSPMENGHLIDRYILNNIRNITSKDIPEEAKLNIDTNWTVEDEIGVTKLADEADKNTVPVCRDCNILMTNVNSETVAVYYGLFRASWFKGQRVPIETLVAKSKKMSTAKMLEAVFLFFTLQPKPPAQEDDNREPALETNATSDANDPPLVQTDSVDDRRKRVLEHMKKQTVTLTEANDFVGELVAVHFRGHGTYEGQIGSIIQEDDKVFFVVTFSDGEVKKYSFRLIKQHITSLLKQSALDDSSSDSDQNPSNAAASTRSKKGPKLSRVIKGVRDLAVKGATANNKHQAAEEGKLFWVLKTKEDLWRDTAIMKTVSHLMQWGAAKHPRHRALAIFWSAYYLWITFLVPSQQMEMPFYIWFVHVFKFYYQKLYTSNDWFSHDALTISQLTNVNTAMYSDDTEPSLAPQWFDWVRKQLHVLQVDITGLSLFVYLGDMDAFRIPELLVHIPRKEHITQTLDLVREHVTDYETLLQLLFQKLKERGEAGPCIPGRPAHSHACIVCTVHCLGAPNVDKGGRMGVWLADGRAQVPPIAICLGSLFSVCARARCKHVHQVPLCRGCLFQHEHQVVTCSNVDMSPVVVHFSGFAINQETGNIIHWVGCNSVLASLMLPPLHVGANHNTIWAQAPLCELDVKVLPLVLSGLALFSAKLQPP